MSHERDAVAYFLGRRGHVLEDRWRDVYEHRLPSEIDGLQAACLRMSFFGGCYGLLLTLGAETGVEPADVGGRILDIVDVHRELRRFVDADGAGRLAPLERGGIVAGCWRAWLDTIELKHASKKVRDDMRGMFFLGAFAVTTLMDELSEAMIDRAAPGARTALGDVSGTLLEEAGARLIDGLEGVVGWDA